MPDPPVRGEGGLAILVVEGCCKVIRRSGSIAVLSKDSGERVEASLPDLELAVIVGERVSVTSSALITLLSHGVPVVVLSGRSEVYGVLFDVVQVGSVNIRGAQYRCLDSEPCRLAHARSIVISKLRGMLNVVRYEYKYHGEMLGEDLYRRVKESVPPIIEEVERCNSLNELRVLEGKGSKALWEALTKFVHSKYQFTGRDPRKGDAINCALNFTYAVLYGLVTKALVTVGLDPFNGFIHTSKPGRTSLTYDLSEIFKPLAIHATIQASRKTEIKTLGGSKMLKPRSLEILITHLYSKLSKESEKITKRRSLWQLPIHETQKLKDSILKELKYKPYIYEPVD